MPVIRHAKRIAATALSTAALIAVTAPVHARTLRADSGTALIVCAAGTSVQQFSNPITYDPHETNITETGTVFDCVSGVPGLSYGTYEYHGHGKLSCLGGDSVGQFIWTWHRSNGSVLGTTIVGLDANDLTVATRVNGNNVATTTAEADGGSIAYPSQMVYTEQLLATDELACLGAGLKTQTGTSLGLTFLPL